LDTQSNRRIRYAIDPRTNKVVATILCDVPGTGGDIAAGEGFVWVRAKQELLLMIDPKKNKVVEIFGPPAGSGAVRAGRGTVWITAHDINKIWRLDLQKEKSNVSASNQSAQPNNFLEFQKHR